VTLGCDNFDAVNSTAENPVEPDVLKHSKHRIKPIDRMQNDIGVRSTDAEATSADPSIHSSLSASGYS